MIELEMEQAEFIDMIKKMAIPVKSGEEPFFFSKIALTSISDDEIEWIGKFQYGIAWVRVKCTLHTDISEPVQIPIDVSDFLKCLKSFRSKDMISFTHSPDQDDILTTERKKGKRIGRIVYTLRKTTVPTVRGILEELPFRFEKGTDIILYKNGLIEPNIYGSCDVQLFKDLINHVSVNKKLEKREKKKWVMSGLYNIYVDGENHQIKTVAGNEHCKSSIVDDKTDANVFGCGELHYSSGFAEVINLLSGEIKFYAVDNGPLWIMQDTNRMKIRYLIAPAPVYTF